MSLYTFADGFLHFVGLFLPAVVRPILDSLEASKQVKAPPLTDVSFRTNFSLRKFLLLLGTRRFKSFMDLISNERFLSGISA